ncbi:MAG: copper chaperone PCu(A)C [Chloroflexota bacterium]|nr:copper chaperone PCu(A)C [Chloroflexota bacterium]MDE2909528.1 copper chaperone PCu(A)C [Chloroflexota bacterium]
MTAARFGLPTLLVLTLLLASAACRQQQISAADIQLELQASDTLVGETTLLVSVKTGDGKAVANPGALKVRGDMSHAGMVPVFAQADESTKGVFSLPFEWTMAGGWIIEASLTLPNGDSAIETFRFEILNEAGEDAMPDMKHGNMDGEPGEASAVYMRISNRGAADHIIISAHSAAAERIDFHRTIIEDDIARMEQLASLIIPAGGTLELRPGGAHIMLSGLQEDLRRENSFSLQLKFSTGEIYEMGIHIADMLMSELNDAVEFGDLVFSNRWARPARAGSMAHADMPMTSE